MGLSPIPLRYFRQIIYSFKTIKVGLMNLYGGDKICTVTGKNMIKLSEKILRKLNRPHFTIPCGYCVAIIIKKDVPIFF